MDNLPGTFKERYELLRWLNYNRTVSFIFALPDAALYTLCATVVVLFTYGLVAVVF